MNKLLKIASIILASITLASCGSGGAQPASDSAASSNTVSVVTTEGTTALTPDIPDVKYDGQKLRFLSRTVEDKIVRFYSEIASEEITGEVMNDAVYERTSAVEEKFGVKIVNDTDGDVSGKYSAAYLAGEDNWEAVVAGFSKVMALTQSGYLYDMRSLPYTDFTQPWWDSSLARSLSVGGKLYVAVGAMNTWTDSHTYAVVFNKEFADNYKLDPYALVHENKWDIDEFYSIINGLSADLDGNSKLDEYDQYGTVGEKPNAMTHLFGCGVSVIKKDEADIPHIEFGERLYSAADKIFKVMNSDSYLIAQDYSSKYKDPWTDVLRMNFRKGSSLFYVGGIEQLLIFRDLDTDIGLLPMPKYDEAQENYQHSFSASWSSTIFVPAVSTKLEMTSVLLEYINYYSYMYTNESYYDVLLKGKAMRDSDSGEMLDIIRSSRSADFENAYSVVGLSGILSGMVGKNDTASLASTLASKQEASTAKLDKILEAYKITKE